MTNEEIIKKIDEVCAANSKLKADTNELLNKVRGMLMSKNNNECDLNEEMWGHIFKVFASVDEGGFTYSEMMNIFGIGRISDIFTNHTPQEFLAKIREYEKEVENSELQRGDEVICTKKGVHRRELRAIYYCKYCNEYYVLVEGDLCPQKLSKRDWVLKKTGRHVNIFGALE